MVEKKASSSVLCRDMSNEICTPPPKRSAVITTAAISPPTTGSGMLYLFRKPTLATISRPTSSTTIAITNVRTTFTSSCIFVSAASRTR